MAAAAAAPLVASIEEFALLTREGQAAPAPAATPAAPDAAAMPAGKIGAVSMSRIICGGNLIGGYAHSRDLIYVSRLLNAYFTDEKIMETWALCEQHGINTMIFGPSDKKALAVYAKYRARGGKMQCLGQLVPELHDLKTCVKEAADAGMVGSLLIGNKADEWTRGDHIDKIGEFVSFVKAQGMIAGVGGHELRTPMMVEAAGIAPDFYMKTLHSTNYWSTRRPDQKKEVIDNYGVDNYWCMDPETTVQYMRTLERPWLAYKVLAAGAIHPKDGFKYAFASGADFCVVGMFDFQVAEDAAIARRTIADAANRPRPWRA
jgi:hypothetical protein